MSYLTLPDKTLTKRRLRHRKIDRHHQAKKMETEGRSLQDLFNNGLRAMAHILKRGACSSAGHSKCVLNITATGDTNENLFVDFLNKVLKLTHAHQTIFCYMNVVELSSNRLLAQIYGVWFDGFDTDIKSVALHRCKVQRTENGMWKSSIDLELEKD